MASLAEHKNFREAYALLPDNYYDLIVADPPYFSGPEKRQYYGNAVSKTGIARRDYEITETWEIPTKEDIDEIIRVSRNQIIWGCNYFDYQFGPGRIVWDKVNGSTSFSDCEIAYCSVHDSTRLFRYMWNGAMQGKSITEGHIMQGNKASNEVRIHPTQKPVNLYKWMFQQYAESWYRIGDPYLGSGSSRIAAWDMDIEFEGHEISEKHFNKHVKRFDDYISQLKLPYNTKVKEVQNG